jgi:hypothetical protein
MEHVQDGGGTQRQANTVSPIGRANPAAVVVGGLLLAGFVSRVLKSSMTQRAPERTNIRAVEPEEPPSDPELGAWG